MGSGHSSKYGDLGATTTGRSSSTSSGARAPQPRMSRTDTVNVEIRGKRLAIRTDHDPVYVHQIAGHLDETLRALQAQAPSAAFEKLLMLASMTIIEELFEMRAEMAHLRHDVALKTEALLSLLEQENAAHAGGDAQ